MSGWLAAQRGAVAAVLLLLAVAVQGATEALPKTGNHGQCSALWGERRKLINNSVADPGSGAFLTSGSQTQNFLELNENFLGKKFQNSS
jgi:hypothetical protein